MSIGTRGSHMVLADDRADDIIAYDRVQAGGLRTLTPLVGREAELAELAAWIDGGQSRMLALTDRKSVV